MNRGLIAPPWRLRGWGAMTLQLVDLAAARRHASPELRPIPVWPGKALGGLYVASYETGSTLAYHELVVMAALAAGGGRIGAWIPLIYVDEARSMAGGHAIWGLPKELARFDVVDRGRRRDIVVTQGATVLCEIGVAPRGPAVPLMLPLPAFGNKDRAARFVVGRLASRTGLAHIDVEIRPESPLAPYGLDRPRFGLVFEGLDLSVPVPSLAHERAVSSVYAEPS